MRIKDIYLKNIGPFKEAELQFINGDIAKPPITIITGENGTGKTIVLDAIRVLFLGQLNKIERSIIQNEKDFDIDANFSSHKNFSIIGENYKVVCRPHLIRNDIQTNVPYFSEILQGVNKIPNKLAKPVEKWIINYWTSKLASDSFEVKSLVAPIPENYLLNSLNGIQPNVEVTQLICFFDYLRSSNDPKEVKQGEFLYDLLKKIIKLSLIDGEFRYVERRTLTPIIYQTGHEISLDKLSSGNLYLIQRLVSLLGQMYSVHILNNTEIEDLCNTPGLLLIDEAENHLHPKWQKTFLNSVLDIFPNLQIIATTHSPFIVSSVENANVYVCKSMKDHSIIENKTAEYSNKPIEEILLSPVFNTSSFNSEISELIAERKQAIEKGNTEVAENIKKKLKEINPEYFSYFDVEDILKEISK